MKLWHIYCLFSGTASLNPRSQGRVSIVSIGYIAASNTLPSIIGALMVLMLNPGTWSFLLPFMFYNIYFFIIYNKVTVKVSFAGVKLSHFKIMLCLLFQISLTPSYSYLFFVVPILNKLLNLNFFIQLWILLRWILYSAFMSSKTIF